MTELFTINEKTEGESTSNVRYLEPGIHENVRFSKAVRKETKDGGKVYLAFEFVQSSSEDDDRPGLFTHNEWVPEASQYKTLEESAAAQQKRIKHILLKLMSADEIKLSANTWEEYVDAIVDLCDGKGQDTDLRILIQYQSKKSKYTSFPSFLPFIELQETNPTGLFISKYHKMELAAPDNNEDLVSSIAGDTDTEEESDSLPF